MHKIYERRCPACGSTNLVETRIVGEHEIEQPRGDKKRFQCLDCGTTSSGVAEVHTRKAEEKTQKGEVFD